jgi:DNA-binding XRE family transcriptional regulator
MGNQFLKTNREKARFSAQIHRFRMTNRMTQVELAELMGVTSATIVNVEKANYGASIKVVRAFAMAKELVKGGILKTEGDLKRVPR